LSFPSPGFVVCSAFFCKIIHIGVMQRRGHSVVLTVVLLLLGQVSALRPKDYSEDLLQVDEAASSNTTVRGQELEGCYEALKLFILRELWPGIEAMYDKIEDHVLDTLVTEMTKYLNANGSPEGLEPRKVALVLALQTIADETEGFFGDGGTVPTACMAQGGNGDWQESATDDGVEGSAVVYALGKEMLAVQKDGKKAKLGGANPGSIALASWILALLEPYFRALLTTDPDVPI